MVVSEFVDTSKWFSDDHMTSAPNRAQMSSTSFFYRLVCLALAVSK
jgi:hypothetical protein